MLNLEPLIGRFVEDVLRAIRCATLDELRELAAPLETSVNSEVLRVPARLGAPSRAAPIRRLDNRLAVSRRSRPDQRCVSWRDP